MRSCKVKWLALLEGLDNSTSVWNKAEALELQLPEGSSAEAALDADRSADAATLAEDAATRRADMLLGAEMSV